MYYTWKRSRIKGMLPSLTFYSLITITSSVVERSVVKDRRFDSLTLARHDKQRVSRDAKDSRNNLFAVWSYETLDSLLGPSAGYWEMDGFKLGSTCIFKPCGYPVNTQFHIACYLTLFLIRVYLAEHSCEKSDLNIAQGVDIGVSKFD